ncbi:MAG: hypothetical protein ACK53W_06345, partial [Gemmatimonadota bacterium]
MRPVRAGVRRWWPIAVAVGAVLWPAATARAQQRSAVRVGVELAALNTVGALTLAATDHLMDSPSAWAGDATGFRRRLGVRGVQFATSAVAEVGIAAWRGESLAYRPCSCTGWGRRIGHAALEAVLVGRSDGTRGFAWPIAVGAVVGGAASAPLLPATERVTWTLTRPVTRLLLRGGLKVVGGGGAA